LQVDELTFPEPELYRIMILADGEIIAQRKLNIHSGEQP